MPEPRFNHSSTPLPSAAYIAGTHTIKSDGTEAGDGITTVKTAIDTPNYHGCGIRVTTDITVHNGGTVTVTVKGKTANGVLTTLLVSAALAGSNQTNVLLIFPAATVTANVSANAFLPKYWEISVLVATAAVTFSVNVDILR